MYRKELSLSLSFLFLLMWTGCSESAMESELGSTQASSGLYKETEGDVSKARMLAKEENRKAELKKYANKRVDIYGNELASEDLKTTVKFSERFQKQIAELKENEEIEVELFFRKPRKELDRIIKPSFSAVEFVDGKQINIEINGKTATEQELDDLNKTLRVKARERMQLIKEKELEAYSRLEIEEGLLFEKGSKRVRIKKSELRDIVNSHADIIRSVSDNSDKYNSDGIDDALEAIGVNPNAWNIGAEGDNIGVHNNDGTGRPDPNNAAINTSNLTEHTSSEPLEDHATRTTAAIMETAPEAHVHFAAGTSTCLFRDATGYSSPEVFISSRSNDYNSGVGTTYENCSEMYDDYVYDSRIAHFQLAHNAGSFVSDIAKAYNVITVGGFDDHDNASAFTMYTNSNYLDPETGADKPEIVAPAVDIDIAGWNGRSGTSYATPIAAGFAADLMDAYSYYENRPHVMKASLMANAVDDISGASQDEMGSGRLDWNTAVYNGKRRNWVGSNGSYFTSDYDANGRSDIWFSEYLTAGRTYIFAINWLVPGDYVAANLKPNMDIDLKVFRFGSRVASSMSTSQTYEIVEYTPSVTGYYDVVIERWWNSGTGNVIVGYALNW